MAIVTLKNVTKEYKLGNIKVTALKGVDLVINKGEFVTIAGSSGSGKSTLLNIIGCLDYPSNGEIWIGNSLVSRMSEKELNRLRLSTIGFIFQTFNLIPVLNVYENVELPLRIMKNITAAEKKHRVVNFIEAVGLSNYMKHKPTELSGGQRQRVAIARALVTKPKIVLADEPTANLDSKTGIEIISIMQEINKQEGTTFIFSTHDTKVMQAADEIYHLVDGFIDIEQKPSICEERI
ncbi:ABC transporter ATP-binding protein [Cytobacillus sp. Hm23]